MDLLTSLKVIQNNIYMYFKTLNHLFLYLFLHHPRTKKGFTCIQNKYPPHSHIVLKTYHAKPNIWWTSGNCFTEYLRQYNSASRIWSRKLAAKSRQHSKGGGTLYDRRQRTRTVWDPTYGFGGVRLWRPWKKPHIPLVQAQHHVQGQCVDLQRNKNYQKRKGTERAGVRIGFFWEQEESKKKSKQKWQKKQRENRV